MQPEVIAVAISPKPEEWRIESIPFFCYTEGWKPFGRTVVRDGKEQLAITRERIEYLAERRNKAVEQALRMHPDAAHILMIDVDYLHQVDAVTRLVHNYQKCDEPMILGATTWGVFRNGIRPKIWYYDSWSSIEARYIPLEFKPETDVLVSHFKRPLPSLMPVRSVGGCYIFPRRVWDEGVRYGVVDDLHGCEHNYLCEKSGLPIYLDFSVRMWHHVTPSPWKKRLRGSLGIRTRMRRLVRSLSAR